MASKRKSEEAENHAGGHLTPAEAVHLKKVLLRKRAAILANVDEIEGEALNRSRAEASGDLSYVPIHMADVGTDCNNQDIALSLADGERDLLRDVEDALIRIEEGVYGFCEAGGETIGKTRLAAMPWARYCVDCARKQEEKR